MITLRKILDWSEVWAVIIPLLVLVFRKKQQPGMLPVIVYLLFAFCLNLFADIIGDFKKTLTFLPGSNNVIYNVHSVIRFACFCWFFLQRGKNYYPRIQLLIILTFIVFFIVNFSLFENFLNPDHLNGNLFTAEAFLTLASCMIFYLALLKNDEPFSYENKEFWIVTGVSIYFVVTFFVFLFYEPVLQDEKKFANSLWDIHNYSYITLCIFISKAFYATPRN